MPNPLRHLFPSKARFTEKNLPDQSGKVFIVTGASSGVGAALTSILYGSNGTIYVAARNEEKAAAAMSRIKETHPKSTGTMHFLRLDLNDLTTIKASAEEFLGKEQRLDVLWLNAGVMVPPEGSKTAQGYELQLGTNNIAHSLFLHFLHPLLKKTAETAPKDSVRTIWVSSSAVDLAPKGVIDFGNMDYAKPESAWTKYGRSKAGNAIQAAEFARLVKDQGIISLALNPGNLKTDLQRHMSSVQMAVANLILYEPKFGAYTELYAGLSPEITEKNNGGWVAPFGRLSPLRQDILDPALGRRYREWIEEQTKPYW